MDGRVPLPPSPLPMKKKEAYEVVLTGIQEKLAGIACDGGVPVGFQAFDLQHIAVAEALDKGDALAHCRDLFAIPNQGQTLYLCTNSLGLQPRDTSLAINAVLAKWREEAVTSWWKGGPQSFSHADEHVLPALAALVGAEVHEVVAMNTLSVNMHLMLASLYRPTPVRRKVIVEEGAFPSDMHVLHSYLTHVHRQHDNHDNNDTSDLILVIPRREGEATWRLEDILAFIAKHGQEAALCFLSGVHYASGQLFDMKAITHAAHAQGIVVGWDLAHAVGNVELCLNAWGVDFACWCHYKYLCAGPGAVGGCFVHETHTTKSPKSPLPRLAGWWGQVREERFTFIEHDFHPTPGALGFQLSTPSPLLLACLEASLRVFTSEATGGMKAIREKSILLTGYLQLLLEKLLPDQVHILTPRATEERGCQLSLTFPSAPDCDAASVLKALEGHNVMADVRSPNIIRVAPFPLYTRFVDVRNLVLILQDVLRGATKPHVP